jgi:small-conductance mechanosensitive channel
MIIVIMSAHIVGLVFREVEQAYLLESIAIKRFFPLIRALITSLIWIVWVFYILDSLGVNMSSILTGAGIGGVLLAIASRDIITNLFWSLSILLSRTFEIGEIIRLHIKTGIVYEGIVEEITLNYTKITNLTGEVVFVPNRTIYTETVENISHRRFFDYTYRIPFRKDADLTDIRQRMRLIEDHIAGYSPIQVTYETEIPNAADLVYKVTIMLPEANEAFDDEMRHFLMGYIFVERPTSPTIPDLQK